MIHDEPSPLAGKTVHIRDDADHPQIEMGGAEFRVEDWWDRVYGDSWMDAVGNPAALIYAFRTGFAPYEVPTDNEVLYGKIGAFGHLVHVTEIKELMSDETEGDAGVSR